MLDARCEALEKLLEEARVQRDTYRQLYEAAALRLQEMDALAALVAELKKSQAQSQANADKLMQSNRELQDFAHIASHDLQEPLRKVMAFGDRLRSKYSEVLGEQGHDYLERMLGATARMQTFIDDLLTYSRVTSKGQPFEATDIAKVAREVMSDLEVRIEQTAGRVEIEELPVIDADPRQIRQLIQNLVGNALKFHKKNQAPLVRVHGQLLHDGAQEVLELSITDNGIGFDEQYKDRIFGVFQRLHGRSEFEGTGIGLSVCKKIAERHGGNIRTVSAPDQGATFIVTLPARQGSCG